MTLLAAQAEVSSATLDRLKRAEAMIDDYVGAQDKSIPTEFQGIVSSAVGKVIVDTNPTSQLHVQDGYFIGGVIEIIGGTGKGQSRAISASSYADRSVTIVDDWDTMPDTTSFYRIYQLAQFPRVQDVYAHPAGLIVYKTIPDAVKQAVLAQLEFINAQGDAYFVGSDGDLESENIGNYSYRKGNSGQSAGVSMMAPRARTLLIGLKRSGGTLIADNPTAL